MQNNRITHIFFCLFSISLVCSLFATSKYAFEIIDENRDITWRQYADLDGDGNEEYIDSIPGQGIVVVNFDGEKPVTTVHLHSGEIVGHTRLVDISGDQAPEIIVPMRQKNLRWLEVYSVHHRFGAFDCVLEFATETISGRDFNEDGKYDIAIHDIAAADFNDDGIKDVIADVWSEEDEAPRGIWVFAGGSGQFLWNYETAGPAAYLYPCDVDKDGSKELFITTWSPDNDNEANGMTDSLAYLISLDSFGKLRWRYIIGGGFNSTALLLARINGDTSWTIFNTLASGNSNNKTTSYQIEKRHASSGKVLKFFPSQAGIDINTIVDLDRDGDPEIVASDGENNLLLLSHDLELLDSKKFPQKYKSPKVYKIFDLDRDGRYEMIALCRNHALVLDDKFNIKGSIKMGIGHFGDATHFFTHPVFGPCLFILHRHQGEIAGGTTYQILTHRSASILGIELTSSRIALSLAFGGFAALFFFWGLPQLNQQRKKQATIHLKERRDSLLQTLAAFGHGQTAMENLDRLCLLFKNIPSDESSNYTERLNETTDAYLHFTDQHLHQISNRAAFARINEKIVNAFKSHAAKLTQQVSAYKNHTSSVDVLSSDIPKYVDAVQTDLKNIQHELKVDYATDIIGAIKNVMSATDAEVRDNHVAIKKFDISGSIDIRAFIDPTEFQTIFQELIRNAVHAMQTSEHKELSFHISSEDERVIIDITDTGCGMSDDMKTRIFDRDVTSKKDGGYGLYHAKNILQKYGGKLRVFYTEPGRGTTMRLILKEV